MYRLSEDEETKRLTLYKQGLEDKQIADIVFVGAHTIWQWRTRRGLPRNGKCGRKLGSKNKEKAMEARG